MKVLRLGISDDVFGEIPDKQRSWSLAGEELSVRTGEPVETILKRSWPDEKMAARVERWIEEEEPSVVLFCAAAFWVSYPSAPLMVQRSKVPFARQLSGVGIKLAGNARIAHNAAFRTARRAVVTAAGGAFYFEPDHAAAMVEQWIRRAIRKEDLAVAVRGPSPLRIAGPKGLRDMCERRRFALDSALEEVCRSLHVAYVGFAGEALPDRAHLQGDGIHVNAAGHAWRTADETDVMWRAWQAVQAPAQYFGQQ
jgi:hypothetical protein